MSDLESIIQVVSEECGQAVSAESDFALLGVDSLEFLCIIQRSRNEVGTFPDSIIGSIRTVRDLASAITLSK